MRALIALAPFALLACGAPVQRDDVGPALDRDVFDRTVQPILVERCASADCHGRAAAGLVVYARLVYRADPSRTSIDEPLTDAELQHDFDAASIWARIPAWSGGVMLTRKPLGALVGEVHGGGVNFEGEDDHDWKVLRDWTRVP